MDALCTSMAPLVIIFGASVLIVGIVFFFDHRNHILKNQERLAAIEKGILPKDLEASATAPRECFDSRYGRYRGVKTLFIGAGLALALYVTAGPTAAVWGLFVAFVGMGQLVATWLASRPTDRGAN